MSEPKSYCWQSLRDTPRGKGELIECSKAKCCYDASCRAVFDYWKFANSEKWKRMVQQELEKEVGKKHE